MIHSPKPWQADPQTVRKPVVLAAVVLALTLAGIMAGVLMGLGGFGGMGWEHLSEALGLGTGAAGEGTIPAKIVWDIRLPRTLGAWVAGALLGLAGALAQGLFRNPLADPFLLGSASGASLGVALALVLLGLSPMAGSWFAHLGLTGAAFLGAVAAVLLSLALARGVGHTLHLLLAGVVVGVVLGALSSLVMLLEPQVMQTLQAFLWGSTAFVGWSACLTMLLVWLPCMLLAWLCSPVLDGLALGEATAQSLGLPLGPLRLVLVAVLALATGAAVAQTGLVAFVGLAAPHLVRSTVKVKHAALVLLSSLMGGLLLLLADLLARGLMAPQELPVGVFTAVLGGGYLLWLMYRASHEGGGP